MRRRKGADEVKRVSSPLSTLRKMGRKVKRLSNGRYEVQGCWPDVREQDLPAVIAGLEVRRG